MFRNSMKGAKTLMVGAGSLVAAGAASADPIDTTSVTDAITAAGAAIAVIGAAVLVVVVGVKVWKWLKSAL